MPKQRRRCHVNRYTGGLHQGPNNGWRIDPGDHFTNQSCLTDPRALPINLKQVVGHPMLVTESTWVHPEGYQTEGPFLIAAYQSLTGIAGYYWFAATQPEYDLDPSLRFLNVKGQHPLFKWSCSTPSLMAQFPAAALIYRKGLLKQGEPVVHEERPLGDLWRRRIPLIAEDRSFDPNRYQGATGSEKAKVKGGADPLAFLVGPVDVKYGGDPAKTFTAELARYIDKEKKVLTSITGEIRLNYGIGVCTIDAPKVQGASGFLRKAGAIQLGDVGIRSGNDYATVYVLALDDQPIRTSRKLLVQVGTQARLTGWKAKPAEFQGNGKKLVKGFEIMNTGRPPWRIIDTDVTLEIANPALRGGTLLDTSGYAARDIRGEQAAGKLTLRLPANTLYLVVQ